MIGDHHGRTAGRATLLVRAVDEILGTHRIVIKYSRRTDRNRDLAPTRRSCQTAAHGPCIEF